MAMLFPVNGNPITVKPANGTNFTTEELWKLIGGYVECLTLNNDEIAIFDKEGDLKNLPYNSSGSKYVSKHYYSLHSICLLGSVLICKKNNQFK